MPIETICQGCARKLRVEDHFAGRKARCPHCRRVYTVPELVDGGQPADSDSASEELASKDQWRVLAEDGQEYGPVGKGELDQWVAEGRITGGTSVRREDDAEWQVATELYPQISAATEVNPFSSSDAASSQNPYREANSGQSSILLPHRGGVLLTLGIVGLLCCQICSPIAWALGHSDIQAMNAGRMNSDGRGLTQAGMVLGVIGTALMIFAIGGQVLVLLLALA